MSKELEVVYKDVKKLIDAFETSWKTWLDTNDAVALATARKHVATLQTQCKAFRVASIMAEKKVITEKIQEVKVEEVVEELPKEVIEVVEEQDTADDSPKW